MQIITDLLSPVLPDGFDIPGFIRFVLVVVVGMTLLGFVGRIACGKRSSLNHSVSAAIGILFMYAASVVAYSFGSVLNSYLAPLPFVTLAEDQLHLFSFIGATVPEMSSQVLSMVILAFLVNLIDSWLPKSKKLLGWLLRSVMTVVLAFVVHGIATRLIAAFLPEILVSWATTALLAILAFMLLLGLLKVVLGVVLAAVNPIIAGIYAFFFSHRIGKMLSQAVLTTVILSVLILILNHTGFTVISIASSALAAYIPLLVILLILWYILGHLL